VAAARAFIDADRARAAGSTFAIDAGRLIAHALAERWTAVSYAALGDLADFLVVATAGARAVRRSERAVCVDVNLTRLGAAPGKLLDPMLAARHARLARDLVPLYRAWLGDPRDFDTAFTIERAVLDDGLWVGCSDAGFDAARASLLRLLDELHAAATFDDRFDVGQRIAALVRAQTCP
jgi:hypothetical protein